MLMNITGHREDDGDESAVLSHQETVGLRDASGSWICCCFRGSAADISALYLNKGFLCLFSLHKAQPIFRVFGVVYLSSRLN